MTDIREPTVQDIPGIYRVCFETSDPQPEQNPELVGHVFSGAYVQAHPDYARVVADNRGVSGYLFGCPDTRAFEAWCDERWWPTLRAQYPLEGAPPADVEWTRALHNPERAPDELVAQYPSHLHIDLLPRAQGSGLGRVLVTWLCDKLAQQKSPGVHLGVGTDNTNATQFYEHLGFMISEVEPDVTWMVRALR